MFSLIAFWIGSGVYVFRFTCIVIRSSDMFSITLSGSSKGGNRGTVYESGRMSETGSKVDWYYSRLSEVLIAAFFGPFSGFLSLPYLKWMTSRDRIYEYALKSSNRNDGNEVVSREDFRFG